MIDRMMERYRALPAWGQRIILDLVVVVCLLGSVGWSFLMGRDGGPIMFGIVVGLILRFTMKRTWGRPQAPTNQ